MNTMLSTLLGRLSDGRLSGAPVIPWSCPIPSFGDITSATVATLGLNPSNREFVDPSGIELDGPHRRFHTLTSLGLACWADAGMKHRELIWESCRDYFLRNPYDTWFGQLDYLMGKTKASYYEGTTKACHLDLIPYATACKWTGLSQRQRSALLSFAGDTLGLLLQDSPVKLLILNGRSVVENFETISGVRLERQVMPEWELPRQSTTGVLGFSYKGLLCEFAGTKLRRDVLVLGFNHNIQSSFGVTHRVRESIQGWIGQATSGVLA